MYKIIRSSISSAAFICSISSVTAQAQILFEETTSTAGSFHVGESWGASWGDWNGDGRPDIYASNHRDRPSIYRNNGDGTFTDVVLTVDQSRTWLDAPLSDSHGGAWTDFDADGDKDLIVATGSGIPPQFFVNEGGIFSNQTSSQGIPDDGGGRMTAAYDFNNDSLLDFAIMNSGNSTILEQQAGGGFVKVNSTVGIDCNGFRSNYAQLSDINDDASTGGAFEFFCMRDGTSPARVYDTSTTPFVDISTTVPTAANVIDSVIADFDGDLLTDIFMVRGSLRPSQSLEVSPQKIETSLAVNSASGEKQFFFQSAGRITVNLTTRVFGPFKIFIGSSGVKPAGLNFTLDPTDPDTWGLMEHDQTTDLGLYVGYDTSTSEWRFQLSPGGKNVVTYFVIDTDAPISGLAMSDLEVGDLPITPKLFMNSSAGFTEESATRGLDTALSCAHAVAGDMDNDMDIDIYLLCRGGVENIVNRLYENQGDGTFIELANAGGAQGVTGQGLESKAGTGESVVIADYDVDGFLDLFVLNGLNLQPLHVGGPNQLFRNLGNGNHWLEIDLVGTASNIDAIGTKVYATAGGKTQLREQNGAYHRWSQDDQRIHFGLGSNTLVNLSVVWPNGDTDFFNNVAVDQIYKITQDVSGNANGTISPVVFGAVPEFPAAQPGDECGEPKYDPDLDRILMIWKDCVNDTWHLRAMSGGSATTVTYAGNVFSNQVFTNVTPFSQESGDTLDFTTDPQKIDFVQKMLLGGSDGFNFSLPSSANACIEISTLPAGSQVLLGSKHIPVSLPLDLQSLGSCININIDDVEVTEAAANASFTISLSSPSNNTVTVDYATVDGSAVAGQDYSPVSSVLVFPPGQQTKMVDVPILQDTDGESTENFTLELSNAVNANISDASGLGSITDDDASSCGPVNYDAGSEQDLFIWRDCDGSDLWHLRSAAGGSSSVITYGGSVTSDQGFTMLQPFRLEGTDLLDNNSDVNVIDYSLRMVNSGVDGFDFKFAPGSNVCFDPSTLPAGSQALIGSDKMVISEAINLVTLENCTTQTAPDQCGEPSYDSGIEKGIFIWQDCAGSGEWSIRMTAGGDTTGPIYNGTLDFDQNVITVAPFSIEDSDVLDFSSNPQQISYSLRMWNAAIDGFDFMLPDGTNSCFDIPSLPNNAQIFLGESKMTVTAPFNLETIGSCQ